MSSHSNGSGSYTVTLNVRDYYPNTSGLPTDGGTGVPSGASIVVAGTGTDCDGPHTTINAQGTANPYNYGVAGYQDLEPYKLQFTSQSVCAFHNLANIGRMAFSGQDYAGNIYLFQMNGDYDHGANPNFGLPVLVQMRKSTNGGVTWSEPSVIFADESGSCNEDTDNCDLFPENFTHAPNGNFILFHHLIDLRPGDDPAVFISTQVTGSMAYSQCNPNLVDCTVAGNWVTAPFPLNPPGKEIWNAGAIFGFVMPNGTDIAAPMLAIKHPGYEYLAISRDNGNTWPQMIPVSDGQSYTELPTNETAFISFGKSSILGFARNLPWTPTCTNMPPTSQCAGPNGAGGLLMMYSANGGANWSIQPISIPLTQPLCGGNSSATLLKYEYISPQLVSAPQPGLVTLTFGERQSCSGSIAVAYLRTVTFDPALIASQPSAIGNPLVLDSTTSSLYIAYGNPIPLSPSEYLLTYEKGCSLSYCFVSQNTLIETAP
jgi:hypothetical protein